LLHLAVSSTDALQITPDDRIALMPSSSFIGTARCIFGALLNGASLHPFDVNTEGLRRFADWLAAERITIYHFAPTFFRHFVAALEGRVNFPCLRLVYLGGEPVRRADVDSFRKHFAPDAVLVNGYGSTEAGAIRRYFIDRETPIDSALVPVGYPVADKEVVILDEVGKTLGPGCVGEIAVKSRYLSPGYWGEPQATHRAFSETANEGVLYRTGDLGRLSAVGCLEHLGRKDSQIKIRGHRINAADVEKALLDMPITADVAVVARPDKGGELRLVAYIASRARRDMTVGSVRRVLEKSLPSYSIPTSFVFVDEIPRTPTGKVEVSALPDPRAGRPNLDQPKASPRTELERWLVNLWSDVLEVDQVGIYDNFLDLGGDSLRATRLLNRVQSHLDSIGEYLYMTALFDSPTVAEFATYLERNYPETTFGLGRNSNSTNASGTERKLWTLRRTPIDESALTRLRERIASAYRNNDWGSPVKNRRMVFLLCSSRSGSTLLRVILGGHPQLFAPPELRLLGYNTLAEREAAHSGENAMMLEGAIRAVMQVSGRSAIEAADLMGQLASNGTTSASFYRMLQDWLGDNTLLVDKTPSYALHPLVLANAEAHFDEPYYIHLVRHPVGVICSSEEMRLDLVSPYRQCVSSASELAEMLWLISHENILRFLEDVPSGRQQRVQFENLVQQPELVVRQICEFLNLEFDPQMLRPYENQSEKMTDGIHPETKMIGDPKFHRHRDIDPSAAHRWKNQGRECHLADMTWALAEVVGYQRP
jgi:aryl carrier-like protein